MLKSLFNWVADLRPATLLKRDSSTDVLLFSWWFIHFLRIPNLKSANDCFWNLFFHLDSLFNNLRFCLPNLSSLLLTLLQSEAVVRWCSVKKVFQQILQISQENTCSKDAFLMKLQIYILTLSKQRFRHRCFFVNSGKFLIKPFLKNPSDGCFCRNTRSVS